MYIQKLRKGKTMRNIYNCDFKYDALGIKKLLLFQSICSAFRISFYSYTEQFEIIIIFLGN